MNNPLGTKGNLASAYSSLVSALWNQEYHFIQPLSFRKSIVKFAPAFDGNEQHDSQEFLAFLLDGLHEGELCRPPASSHLPRLTLLSSLPSPQISTASKSAPPQKKSLPSVKPSSTPFPLRSPPRKSGAPTNNGTTRSSSTGSRASTGPRSSARRAERTQSRTTRSCTSPSRYRLAGSAKESARWSSAWMGSSRRR